MAISLVADGTADVVLDTPMTLHTETDAGTYVLVVDLNPLAAGDAVTLTIEVKTLTGSTARRAYRAFYQHAQAVPVAISVPVPSLHSVAFIIEQTDGVVRDFDWSVVQLDA